MDSLLSLFSLDSVSCVSISSAALMVGSSSMAVATSSAPISSLVMMSVVFSFALAHDMVNSPTIKSSNMNMCFFFNIFSPF